MPLGIRLIFRKDLAPQFRDFQQSGFSASYIREQAHVLGSLDYLKCESLVSLPEILKSPGLLVEEPLGGASDLILFPSPGSRRDAEHVTQRFKSAPLVFLVRITLSSISLDTQPHWDGAVDLLDRAAQQIADEWKRLVTSYSEPGDTGGSAADFRTSLSTWFTFGGPDVVCLAFPTSAKQLALLCELNNALRSLALGSIFDGSVPLSEKGTCHAFASVQGTLVYQNPHPDNDWQILRQFREDESQLGLQYISRISVCPGHENSVLSRIQQVANAPLNQSLVCVGYRSLLVQFGHLEDAVRSIEASLRPEVNGKRIRSPEVTAVRTTVAIATSAPDVDPDENTNCHTVPSLSDELTDLLTQIENRFIAFGDNYLGPSHRTELMQIMQSFRSSFRRNDKASGMRDLIPFFDQLSRAMQSTEMWSKLYSDFDRELIADQFSLLFSHLWRAIKNRIEHRDEPLDPAFPNTIEYGAGKLVNAYTVAAWAATSMLHVGPVLTDRGKCSSERFAAAVAAGSEGTVRVVNILSALSKPSGHTLAKSPNGQWNSPLLLLSVSGPALFRPELAFALCFHEIAEQSEWLSLPHWSHLNSCVNRSNFGMFLSAIGKLLKNDSDDYVSEDGAQTRANIEAFANALHQAADDLVKRTSVDEKKLQKTLSPRDYLESLYSRLKKLDLVSLKRAASDWEHTDQQLEKMAPRGWFYAILRIQDGKSHGTIKKFIDGVLERQRECLADTAMVASLCKMLELKDPSDGVMHVNYLFSSMISSSIDYRKPMERHHVTGMLQRWAFQVACLLKSRYESKELRERVADEISSFPGRYREELEIGPEALKRSVLSFWRDSWVFYSPRVRGGDLITAVARALPEIIAPSDISSEVALQEIVKDFRALWLDAVAENSDSQRIDEARYRFIARMWAKAQKFRIYNAFS